MPESHVTDHRARRPELLPALGLRPLSARSVVASVLLGTHPPRLSAAALVELCGRFGISGGTTRVALSRMVAAGELAAEDGHYRLIGAGLLSRQRTQDDALDPPAGPWTGDWRMAVVVSSGRAAAERIELRRALADARFAQWREGVWLRPDNLGRPGEPTVSSRQGRRKPPGDVPVRWLVARPDDDPAALAGELWDLPAWSSRGAELLAAAPEEPGDLVAAPPSGPPGCSPPRRRPSATSGPTPCSPTRSSRRPGRPNASAPATASTFRRSSAWSARWEGEAPPESGWD